MSPQMQTSSCGQSEGKRCPQKSRYPNEYTALLSLAHMRAKGRSEKRIYRCHYCRGYHTTGALLRMRTGPWPDAPAGLA